TGIRPERFPVHILVFIGPAFAIYTLVMVYPIFNSLSVSFYTMGGPGVQPTFAGIDNYIKLVTTGPWAVRFWSAVAHNLLFFLIQFLIQNPIGLLLAVLISRQAPRFGATCRTILYVPAMLSIVLAGFMWQLMLNPLWGIVKL